MQGIRRLLAIALCVLIPLAAFGVSRNIEISEDTIGQRAHAMRAMYRDTNAAQSSAIRTYERSPKPRDADAGRRLGTLFAICLYTTAISIITRRYLLSPVKGGRAALRRIYQHIGRAPPHIVF